ncbi:S10 family peptidase [Pedomonas mirosovicensis]|uniref:S10 family peptidase n=1 Tax=Pedomonas mirosovicensis TaxID=2908641 RepID=UPI002169870C|nr:peptidase S10 [Pedomonas mirosovicensis]MCH8684839.1 peptidase S10 [Pedomonas mirosovicensis]
MKYRASLLALALLAAATPAVAAEKAPAKTESSADKAADKAIPEPKVFVTEHTGRFNGQEVRYKAIAGETYLRDEDGEPRAAIFSTTYIREGVKDTTHRPVIFLFNGGPGSASLWLHMGAFGPKRLVLPSDAKDDGAPPYNIVDNDKTLLDIADLVFIDPVGTGFSRAIGKGENKDYWGVDQDAESIAKFIRQWTSEHKRWNSPKYVMGESYGTTRAAKLAEVLEGGFNGYGLNGVVLISAILDFSTARFQTGNETPYIGFLPTYAATHWYHHLRGKTDVTLEQHVQRAREFALNEYAPALLKGDRITPEEKARVRKTLSELTGLSEQYLDQTNLRINAFRFMKQFGRNEGYTVGRFDTRYTGKDLDEAGETFDNDPSGYAIAPSYTAAFNQYVLTDLKVDLGREYKVLTSDPGRNWDWVGQKRGGYINVNVAEGLGQAMRENKDLRVMLATGYYDLATPFFAAENTLASNGLVKERVSYTYYPAGHMMYLNHPSFDKLLQDIRNFVVAGQK